MLYPNPPSKAGTRERLAPSQGGGGATAHREAGIVVHEGCGTLAGIGQHPCWAWHLLFGHSHLGMGNAQAALRLQGWQRTRQPPRALLLLAGGSPRALRTEANSERAELLEAQGRGQNSSSGTMLPLTGHVSCHFLSIKWAWCAHHPHVTAGDSETLWLMGRARI